MTQPPQSIDEFLFGQRSAMSDPPDVVRAEPAPLVQTTMLGGAEPVARRPKAAEALVALVLRSGSGNTRPHVVTVITFPDGTKGVSCICEAVLNIAKRPGGCWGMTYAREIIGIPEPGGPS